MSSSESDSDISQDQYEEEESGSQKSESSGDDQSPEDDQSSEEEKPTKKKGKEKSVKDKKNKEASKKAKKQKPPVPTQTPEERIKEKYSAKKGKCLCLRFPKRVPEDVNLLESNVKELCDRIIKVHRPRQPSTRICLVDFATPEDCKKAFKQLKKTEVDGKRLCVTVPKTDSEDFIAKLVARRQKKLAQKRAQKKLKKSATKTEGRIFTSTIIVGKIPASVSVNEVKDLFPNAVEFKFVYAKKPGGHNSAVVTLPTPKDATIIKRKKLEIGENKLSVAFVGADQKKKNKKKQSAEEGEAGTSENGQANEDESHSKKGKRKLKKEKSTSDDNTVDVPAKKKKKDLKKVKEENDEDSSPAKKKIKQKKAEKGKREADDSFVVQDQPQKQNKKNKNKNKHENSPIKQEHKQHKSDGSKQKDDQQDDQTVSFKKFQGTASLKDDNKNSSPKKKHQNQKFNKKHNENTHKLENGGGPGKSFNKFKNKDNSKNKFINKEKKPFKKGGFKKQTNSA
ncbi:unnamed protein product [Hermetia illucens]|uniref:RRM domain-containing protein n=1 Tax=Hermetia illucens TaxID=343691 RepID=A0A7R8YSB1_HERIL|nr:cylicin-1 [Hermetia illucens]CAD7083386.1 unnamed protein product [Hermetia illucens]